MKFRIGDVIESTVNPEVRGVVTNLAPLIYMCECPACDGQYGIKVSDDMYFKLLHRKFICDSFDKDGEE